MMNKYEPFPSEVTNGDKYGPAMEIDNPEDAAQYFERCVEHSMSFGNLRAEAERIERFNIGYYAGYYGTETQKRVQDTFGLVHPVFGRI